MESLVGVSNSLAIREKILGNFEKVWRNGGELFGLGDL